MINDGKTDSYRQSLKEINWSHFFLEKPRSAGATVTARPISSAQIVSAEIRDTSWPCTTFLARKTSSVRWMMMMMICTILVKYFSNFWLGKCVVLTQQLLTSGNTAMMAGRRSAATILQEPRWSGLQETLGTSRSRRFNHLFLLSLFVLLLTLLSIFPTGQSSYCLV